MSDQQPQPRQPGPATSQPADAADSGGPTLSIEKVSAQEWRGRDRFAALKHFAPKAKATLALIAKAPACAIAACRAFLLLPAAARYATCACSTSSAFLLFLGWGHWFSYQKAFACACAILAAFGFLAAQRLLAQHSQGPKLALAYFALCCLFFMPIFGLREDPFAKSAAESFCWFVFGAFNALFLLESAAIRKLYAFDWGEEENKPFIPDTQDPFGW